MTAPATTPGSVRQPGVALWRQIAEALRRDITAGNHKPGDRLPTEQALARAFQVNRHTARRAMEELSRAGLIRVEHGRGAFVAEDVLDYAVAPRTRFSEWIRRHNREPSGQVLVLEDLAAPAAIAEGLKLRPGARLVRYRRLGFADDRPVSLTDHYFPAARLPGIHAALREEASITAALGRAGVADYRRLRSRVSAALPTAEEAELLRTAPGRPLLFCENVNVDPHGRIVEFAVSRYPTPRVHIVFEP